jgi:ABC-2 type transport system permease protein
MRNLLFKELTLAFSPWVLFFLLFAALLLIPSWPFVLAMAYVFLAFTVILPQDRENKDTIFTVSLPVPKRDVVLAKACTLAMVELLQVLAAIPFAVARGLIGYGVNQAGMNVNVAFFGVALVMYGVFNVIFLPWYYRTARSFGAPWTVAAVAAVAAAFALDAVIRFVPVLNASLNTFDPRLVLGIQAPTAAAALAFFALLTALAVRWAGRVFEKVDL